jgi:acyl-CoA synthetase (AMP-forming)/AMP-acid ligase II
MFIERFQPYGLRPEALTTSYAMAENVFAVTQGGIESPVNVEIIEQRRFQNQQIAKQFENYQHNQNFLENYNQPNSLKMLSAGHPIEGTQIKIVDSEGNNLPERHEGEIILKSNCMLTGYYNRPDLTKKAIKNDWYYTGDLGYMADGELYVSGRKKDLIIVGGKNIYPQDLEYLAGEVPDVHPGRVVAFGVYNNRSGTEDVVIIAEVDDEAENEKDRIAQQIRQKVTQNSDIALRYVVIVERNWLIKTSSGKIARSANKDKYLDSQLSQ